MKNKSIIMMGTPTFAVASLNAIVEAGIEVKAVVSTPDKPAGRGRKLKASAMAERAMELNIPVLKPTRLKEASFHEGLRSYNADLFVVVAFRMLPEVVWAMPPLGTINLHGSLLPDYRGAAPINRAVMNGESMTGATTFFIQQKIDTGDIIDTIELEIGENETAGEVHDRMMIDGAALLVNTIQSIFSETVRRKPQSEFDLSNINEAPKIHTGDRKISWTRPCKEVHDFIRGLSPYPAAWTTIELDGKKQQFKLLRSLKVAERNGIPGSIVVESGKLFIHCSDGGIEVLELQPPGKRAMPARAYLNGGKLKSGMLFN